jgi:tetratricopeptide (TPR) repeat protein
MPSDAPYRSVPLLHAARALQRAGQWDAALRVIAKDDRPLTHALRAEILVDRHLWRVDPADDALASVGVIAEEHPALATLLTGQLEYWRRLLKTGNTPLHDDPVEAFTEAAVDDALYGWAMFWRGVSTDNLLGERERAASGYLRALTRARIDGDQLLESYCVRHQGFQLLETDHEQGLALLRRSMNLRAALGARPATAAAQAALGEALGDAPEGAELRALASDTAVELDLTWLKPE